MLLQVVIFTTLFLQCIIIVFTRVVLRMRILSTSVLIDKFGNVVRFLRLTVLSNIIPSYYIRETA